MFIMDYLKVLCSSPHCNKLLNSHPDGSPAWSIIKCGHVYHASCFENVKRDQFCPKCQIVFNPRQSCKINFHTLRPGVDGTDDDDDDDEALEVAEKYRTEFYQWMFYDSRTNVTTTEIKEFACPLGGDDSGQMFYVARAYFNDDIVPAYFDPYARRVLTIYESEANVYTGDIDILDIHNERNQATFEWVECQGVAAPDNAVATGETSSGHKLYTIRSKHLNKMLYGHLDTRMQEGQVIFALQENPGEHTYQVLGKTNYEVLVRKPSTMHAKRFEI